jgi:hypothetical protein
VSPSPPVIEYEIPWVELVRTIDPLKKRNTSGAPATNDFDLILVHYHVIGKKINHYLQHSHYNSRSTGQLSLGVWIETRGC